MDDLVPDLFQVTYLPAAVDRDVLAENSRSRDEQMASLRFYDLAAECPTNAGVLLFAKDPLRWIPGSYVQFVRWAGTTMASDAVAERRFSGDLLTVLREIETFVSLPAQSRPVAESAFRERSEADYPPVAVRELLLNAIMHRSYESNAPVRFNWFDNRIEIQNPGGLYGMASPENFPRQTDYRNPVVAAAMATLGYVNAFGRGVIRSQEALRRNGNLEAEFTFEPSCIGEHLAEAMTTIAFFNNKGGVGKTTLVYHLAWMYADLGVSVVAADLDPQANLTAMFLDEDRLEELWPDGDHPQSILGSISPILRGLGDIKEPHVEDISTNLGLVVGDLGLSRFEAKLSAAWNECMNRDEAAFRTESAFHRTMLQAAEVREANLILVDVGPNFGAINRAAMIAANFVAVPLAPDLFSLQGLRNLGPTLRDWRGEWGDRLDRRPADSDLSLPSAEIRPAGYIVMQHAVRVGRPVQAYQKWITRIPGVYRTEALGDGASSDPSAEDEHCLATLKHYRSLMPMAQEARKPMFQLKAADGALGAHTYAVQECYEDFEGLARAIAAKCGIEL